MEKPICVARSTLIEKGYCEEIKRKLRGRGEEMRKDELELRELLRTKRDILSRRAIDMRGPTLAKKF